MNFLEQTTGFHSKGVVLQIGGADAVGRQEVGSGLGSRRTTLGKIWDLAKKVAVVV